MSTHDEIMDVYNEEINQKSRLVESKLGKAPFYNNFQGFCIEDIGVNTGADRIVCSDFKPLRRKWSKKYYKSQGE
jgi:hypothetical protein